LILITLKWFVGSIKENITKQSTTNDPD